MFETAEWLHTGIYTALPGSVVVAFAGSPADDEVARTIAGRSGRVIAVGSSVDSLSSQAAGVIPAAGGAARIVGRRSSPRSCGGRCRARSARVSG